MQSEFLEFDTPSTTQVEEHIQNSFTPGQNASH